MRNSRTSATAHPALCRPKAAAAKDSQLVQF